MKYLITKSHWERLVRFKEQLVLVAASIGDKKVEKYWEEYANTLFPELELERRKQLEELIAKAKELL